jgi:6-pyruvoyltetrahydropterin/6-carboxytetrahydropterin synthase
MHELSQRFMFEAAHTLHRDFETESSRRVHGHTYLAELTVVGSPQESSGMLVDLAVLRNLIEEVRDLLDHRLLDEVKGLGLPTLENLCTFIAGKIRTRIPQLMSVRVWREASGDSCRLVIGAVGQQACAESNVHKLERTRGGSSTKDSRINARE